MKNRFLANFAVLTLAVGGALSGSAVAQTTQEGAGPSEQPSAPMEIGVSGPQDQEEAAPPLPDQSANDQASEDQAPEDQASEDQGPADQQPGDRQSGEQAEETKQGVARISMMHGDVSTQRGDSGDWSAAALNAPVVSGDKVSTGDDARAELQLDFANLMRLGPKTQANVANFTKQNIQIQMGQGLADYIVFKNGEAEPEIDTPNVSIHPAHSDGVFRIEVRADGDTIVIVRKGDAQISTPQGSTEIHSGQMATIRGSEAEAQYRVSDAPGRDDWDRWNSDRDRIIQNAQSWHHTNRYYVGSEDLDSHGRWTNVPDYGDVWVPNEPEGWVPYRNGNWTYEPYYGWTWVGYEPWGWAPYHYGRWFSYGSSWAWWPGPVYGGGLYRPLWAPAYVSFFGWGRGWGFGAGFGGWGGFGWLPIGPCDRFYPWWGGRGGRFGVVNVRNITINRGRFGGIRPLHGGNRFSNLARIHDNHVGRAFSTVSAGRFGAGRVQAMSVTRQQLRGAHMMTGNMPVVPTRASLSASGRPAAPSTVRNGGPQHFFGSPRSVGRMESFQQQTARLQQSMQRSRVTPIEAGGRVNNVTTGRGSSGFGTGQKPSAGLGAREGNNPRGGNSSRQTMSPSSGAHPGLRPFSPPNHNNRSPGVSNMPAQRSSGSNQENGSRGGFRPSGPVNGPQQRSVGPNPSENGNRGGFRPFSPPSRSDSPRGGEVGPANRGSSGGYWNRTAPSSPSSPRSYGSPSGTYGRGNSRPQLDMRQPVVQPRSSRGGYGGYRGSPGNGGGGYRGSPGYSAPSAPRSAPGYGGGGYHGSPGRAAPSAPRSAPSYGGGSHSAPSAPSGGHGSSGGGHSSGGGGGHSSSGGGHSSGGHH
jgi:FecR protein